MSRETVRVGARGLGAELKDLRNQAGMTLRDVTDRLDWSPPTLSRIENGLRDSTTEEVAALLVLYKVTGARNDRLVRLARTIDRPGWWETSATGLPGQLTALRAFEAEATEITTMNVTLVPGLLQTSEYAHAVMVAGRVPAEQIDERVSVRLDRQAILSRRHPPAFNVLIDEHALRRPMTDPVGMAGQIRHLVKMAAKPHVKIRVLRDPRHPAVAGSYVMLDFPLPAMSIVHLEQFNSSLFMDEPEDVRSYRTHTEELVRMALAPAPSQEFLANLAHQYEAEAKEHGNGCRSAGVA